MTRMRFLRSIIPALCVPVLIGLLVFGSSSPPARANGPAATPTACYGPTAPCIAISSVAGGIHPTPTAGSGETPPRPHVQVRAHGVLLGLAIPRMTYPLNALVRVTLTLRNVTNHTVWLESGGPQLPGKTFPQVEVLDAQGNLVYPPALDDFFPYPGPGPVPTALRKGVVLRVHGYAVLRGPQVQASVVVFTRGQELGTGVRLSTPALTPRLTPADTPRVDMRVAGDRVTAMITPAGPVAGRMLYLDAALCGGTNFAEHLTWRIGGHMLTAGCGPLQSWHLTAGWLNHSAAIVDYPFPSSRFMRMAPGE